MGRVLSIIVLGALVAVVAIACSTPTPEQQVDKAAQYVQKGDLELVKAAEKINSENASSARRHFNNALEDYDKALVLLADASLPEEDDDAVSALKNGVAHLENAVKAIEKDDYGKAQEQYSMAQSAFSEARSRLD